MRIPNELSRENWDKARKKDLTVKGPEEDKDQDLASKPEGKKCKPSSDLRIGKVTMEIKVPRKGTSRTEN